MESGIQAAPLERREEMKGLARKQLLGDGGDRLWSIAGTPAMKPLVTDALWERLEPLLPPAPQRRFHFPGRKPLDYRKILTGILFVLKTGIAWADLPAELGCGCGKTCRESPKRWHEARRLDLRCTRCCWPNSMGLTRSTGGAP